MQPPVKKNKGERSERSVPKAVEETVEQPKKRLLTFNPKEMQANIGKLLKYTTFEPKTRYCLVTEYPELHEVFGSREKGIPYGKVIELSGEEHAGKTLIATILAGIAQQDGAGVGRVDLEDSRDPAWEARFGLDSSTVLEIYPKLVLPKSSDEDEDDKPEKKGKFGKKKKKKSKIPRLQSVEEVLSEMEAGMSLLHEHGFKKQFWFVDSVANMRTTMQNEAGFGGQNMRTRNDRALFLSEAFPTMSGLAANYNAVIFLLNQLREKPGVMFGDPLYSPGGRGLRHATSIRARIMRKKSLTKNDRAIGLISLITNKKNKMGGGSVQSATCGFKVLWNRNPAKVEFLTPEEVKEYTKR